MSKSKGNLVGAIEMADKYGCDTGRMYTLFAAPPEKDLEWNEQGIEGSSRFLNKVYRIVERHAARLRDVEIEPGASFDMTKATAKEKALIRKTHQTLKRVTNDFEVRWHFNTSVALIMELVNELQAQEPLDADISAAALKNVFAMLILMLSPIAPHISEELWEMRWVFGGPLESKMAAIQRGSGSRGADRGNHSDQWPDARQDTRGRRSGRRRNTWPGSQGSANIGIDRRKADCKDNCGAE